MDTVDESGKWGFGCDHCLWFADKDVLEGDRWFIGGDDA